MKKLQVIPIMITTLVLIVAILFSNCTKEVQAVNDEDSVEYLSQEVQDSLIAEGDANMNEGALNDANVVETLAMLPAYNHVFMVWFENKKFTDIYRRSAATWLNNNIISQGTTFTNFKARTNAYSQPNYAAFYYMTAAGIADNNCKPVRSISLKNMYTQLNAVQKTFAIYSEDMPAEGYQGCKYLKYRLRHNTVPYSSNTPFGCNKMWSQIPVDLDQAPNFSWLIPNNDNNMHDTNVAYGDNWASTALDDMVDYCTDPSNRSLFILCFDEGSGTDRRIVVSFVGADVRVNHTVATSYGFYNLNTTILNLFGAVNANSAVGSAVMTGWY